MAGSPDRTNLAHLGLAVANLVIIVLLAIGTWGNERTDPRVATLQSEYASISSRLSEDESANIRDSQQRNLNDTALTSKIDGMSTQIATLAAQVGDMQEGIKNMESQLRDPPALSSGKK